MREWKKQWEIINGHWKKERIKTITVVIEEYCVGSENHSDV